MVSAASNRCPSLAGRRISPHTVPIHANTDFRRDLGVRDQRACRQQKWDQHGTTVDAETTARAHSPTDRQKLRSFVDTLGMEVTVRSSAALASNLPAEEWYQGHPVGTFSVVLKHLAGDVTYFGAMVHAGVDDDENDPGRVE